MGTDRIIKDLTSIQGLDGPMPDYSRCAICTETFGTNGDSSEHVMPAAIGGRLKVKGFICRKCNSAAGSTWDAELVSQLHPMCLLFGVDRERGKTPGLPIITTAGEELVVNPDGGFSLNKPSYSAKVSPEGVKIQIQARSMEEAKRMLTGVKQKYPSVDVDQILASAQVSTSYPKGLVHHSLDFGGEVSGRSIVKSALSMAHHAGIATDACGDALAYLRDPSAPPCFGYYQATDLVADRPQDVPLHCVSVTANPHTGLVLGYAEYFGVQRVVVCLGRRYAGAPVTACYAIDPRTGTQLNLSVELTFGEADIDAIYDYKMIPDGAIQEAFASVMPAALKKKFEAERDRVARDAIEYGFANSGAKPGEMLTEEHIKALQRLVAQKLTPFILHHLSRQAIPTGLGGTDPPSDEIEPKQE